MKNKTNLIGIGAAALLTLTAADARAAQDAEATKTKKIVVADAKTTHHLNLYVAKEKGFFAKRGLEVEIVDVKDLAAARDLVVAGKADAYWACPTAVIAAIANGAPIRIIAQVKAPCTSVLVVPPASSIQDIADLKGKRVAGISPTCEAVISYVQAAQAAKSPFALEKLAGGPAIAALEAGAVDAAILEEPQASIAELKGYRFVRPDVSAGIPCRTINARTALLQSDPAAMVQIAREHGLLSIADNTFMTPYLQRPLELGFDLVVHSATKFIGGHSDVVAGLAVAREAELGRRLRFIQNAFGAILGPQDAWLVQRGLRTLAVRLDAQQATATRLAAWLAARKDIHRVHHPSLDRHPGRDVHARQADGPGAVVSFELADGPAAVAFLKAVRLPLVGVSLGGVETILSYPATMSHAAMPRPERLARGIGDGLVRLSAGLESFEDLAVDLDAALDAAAR